MEFPESFDSWMITMENHHVQVLLIALGDQHSDERQALPLGIAVQGGSSIPWIFCQMY